MPRDRAGFDSGYTFIVSVAHAASVRVRFCVRLVGDSTAISHGTSAEANATISNTAPRAYRHILTLTNSMLVSAIRAGTVFYVAIFLSTVWPFTKFPAKDTLVLMATTFAAVSCKLHAETDTQSRFLPYHLTPSRYELMALR